MIQCDQLGPSACQHGEVLSMVGTVHKNSWAFVEGSEDGRASPVQV